MSKMTKNCMLGVIFGYVGILLYILSVTGYENIYWNDVIDILRQMVMPFLFTQLWVAIGVEGFRNLYQGFNEFQEKIKKRFEKKREELIETTLTE